MLREIHGNEVSADSEAQELAGLLTQVRALENDICCLLTLEKADSEQGINVSVPNAGENGLPVHVFVPIQTILEAKKAEINAWIGKAAPLMEQLIGAMGRLVSYDNSRDSTVEETSARIVGATRPEIIPSDADVPQIGPREPELGARERLIEHLDESERERARQAAMSGQPYGVNAGDHPEAGPARTFRERLWQK